MFPDSGWPLDDPSQQYFDNILEGETSGGSFLGSSSSNPNISWNIDELNNNGKGKMVIKKLNHNANERDRRKKVNSLYASLRSLIPESGYKKKLSIPETISQVLKYIPEIQNEVEILVEKKEAISRKMFRRLENDLNNIQAENIEKPETQKSFFVGTANQLDDREILIQISSLKSMMGSFSEVLLYLEREGFKLLNMSSFESSEDRLLHNLHLQLVQGTQVMDLESLREKLLSMYQN